jgi:hypothetical protein
MFKKLKEFNEKNKTINFFIVMVILIGMLTVNYITNRNKKNECEMPTKIVDSQNIYEYEMKVYRGEEVIILNVTKYGQKILVEKNEKGLLSNYYIYYSGVYQRDNNQNYLSYAGNSIVENIDNKLFYMEYLDEISINTEPKITDSNVCYDITNKSMLLCLNDDTGKIELTGTNYKITYEFSSIGSGEDIWPWLIST